MASPLLLLLLLFPISILLVLALIVRPRPVRIPIKGRHVLVTGGSSGIGLALARRAAAEGARVSILARNTARLQDARENIRLATGVDPTVLVADVRDAAAVARALDEAGPVDVLVCNQGIFIPQELETQDLEEFRFMIDVNLMGTVHLIKAALPAMKGRSRATGLPPPSPSSPASPARWVCMATRLTRQVSSPFVDWQRLCSMRLSWIIFTSPLYFPRILKHRG